MVSALIQIVVGLLIWKIAPGWVQSGNRKSRDFVKLCLNIIGIVIAVFGIIFLFKALLSTFF